MIISAAELCGSHEAPFSDGEAISLVDHLDTPNSDCWKFLQVYFTP